VTRRPDGDQQPAAAASLHSAAVAQSDGFRVVPVETILGANREAVLLHNGVRYRLRITSNDKLILTK
jgi:hemin uptake protein HemP